MKNIFFFLYALVAGFIMIGLYLRFFNTEKKAVQIKIPFVGSQFSLEKAPSQSTKGKITSMSGSVKWLSRVATQSATLNPTTQIQQGEQVSTEESGKLSINFDNKLNIIISPKTQIDIIQTLPDNLVFNQASGSAVYEKTGSYPVSIRSRHILIENGGSVSVSVDQSGPIITITSISGNSKLAFNDAEYISTIVDLIEGKVYVFNDDTRQGVLK